MSYKRTYHYKCLDCKRSIQLYHEFVGLKCWACGGKTERSTLENKRFEKAKREMKEMENQNG